MKLCHLHISITPEITRAYNRKTYLITNLFLQSLALVHSKNGFGITYPFHIDNACKSYKFIVFEALGNCGKKNSKINVRTILVINREKIPLPLSLRSSTVNQVTQY